LVCVESKDGCKLVPDVCKGGLLANSRVFWGFYCMGSDRNRGRLD
jgi:hypothetical protein